MVIHTLKIMHFKVSLTILGHYALKGYDITVLKVYQILISTFRGKFRKTFQGCSS